MVLSRLNDQIISALNLLEALYFFLQSTQANEARLKGIRREFRDAPRRIRSGLLNELQDEIKMIRRESGAIASNAEFLALYEEIKRKGDRGHLFIPKWDIERRWFRNFGRVIVRWPYVKDHAMVIYDPKNPAVTNQLFELERALFRDAEFLLGQAKIFHKDIKDFRKRAIEDQYLLHTYLRTTATIIFHFLEAYLNGLAFDCLIREHDNLTEDDHDMLIEWDRKRNSRAFVAIERKIFRYPMIFGKCLNIRVDLSACKAAHFLAKDAKELRDALTHPSPHFDRESRTLKKIQLITTITLEFVESVFQASKEYVINVEKTLFGKPDQTVPWLFPRPKEEEV